MRSRLAWALLLVSIAGPARSDLLIENITIVSASGPVETRVGNVLIRNGRIERISSLHVSVEPDVRIIDGRGRFLTPGIMDGHVHASLIPGLGFVGDSRAGGYSELADLYLEQQPRSFLYFGVTQVVDPNPGIAWKRFVAAQLHPDYMRCEVVAAPSTFPMVELSKNLAEKLYPNFIIEASSNRDGANTVDGVHSVKPVIARIAESGALCVKLYFENGYGDANHWPLLRDETIKQITSAAEHHKLLVLAHANSVDMYQQTLRHDIDIIVHGLWNWSLADSIEDLPMEVKAVLDDLRSKAIGFMPTQRIVAGLGELMLPETLEDPEFPNVTPEPLLAWYRTAEAQWFRDELVEDYGGLAPEHIATIIERRTLKRGGRTIRYLNEAGHSILLGSDSPGSPSYVNQPGLNTYRELQMMASIGIPLDDIFKAATINNARQFGISKDYGSVEAGKVANLLILQENPLVEIEAWNRIEHVVLHGVAFFRDEFAARH